MASAHSSIHLHSADQPYIERLPSGSIAVWLEGQYVGPTLLGNAEGLTKLRDALSAFLELGAQAEAA